MSRVIALFTLLFLICSTSQAKDPAKFTIGKVDVQRFDTIVKPISADDPKPKHVYQTLRAPAGSTFVGIVAQLNVDVSDTEYANLIFNRKEAVLTGGGDPIEWTCVLGGYCQTYDKQQAVVTKAPGKPVAVAIVFEVPSNGSVFTLSLGDQKVEVKLPKTTAKMDASKVFDAKIKRVVLLASVKEGDGGKLITNPDGKLLAVTVAWKTKVANVTPPFEPGNFFHWSVNVKSAKDTSPTIGEIVDGKLIGHDAAGNCNTIQTGGSAGRVLSDEVVLVFPVAADLKDFELTVLGTTMDKGRVAK